MIKVFNGNNKMRKFISNAFKFNMQKVWNNEMLNCITRSKVWNILNMWRMSILIQCSLMKIVEGG